MSNKQKYLEAIINAPTDLLAHEVQGPVDGKFPLTAWTKSLIPKLIIHSVEEGLGIAASNDDQIYEVELPIEGYDFKIKIYYIKLELPNRDIWTIHAVDKDLIKFLLDVDMGREVDPEDPEPVVPEPADDKSDIHFIGGEIIVTNPVMDHTFDISYNNIEKKIYHCYIDSGVPGLIIECEQFIIPEGSGVLHIKGLMQITEHVDQFEPKVMREDKCISGVDDSPARSTVYTLVH